MKEGSDNFRSSSIQGLITRVTARGYTALIYEPRLNSDNFQGSRVLNDLNEFKTLSDIIVSNRKSDLLEDVVEKCFTRDIFGLD